MGVFSFRWRLWFVVLLLWHSIAVQNSNDNTCIHASIHYVLYDEIQKTDRRCRQTDAVPNSHLDESSIYCNFSQTSILKLETGIFLTLIMPERFRVTLALLLLETEAAGRYKWEFVLYLHWEYAPHSWRAPQALYAAAPCWNWAVFIARDTLVHRRHQKHSYSPPIRSRTFNFTAIGFVARVPPGKFKWPNAVNECRLLAAPVIINSSDSRGIFSRGGQTSLALRLYLVMDTAGAWCTRIHTQHSLLAKQYG